MLEIFYTKKPVLSEAFIKNILTAYYNIPNPTICKTIHGKPYLIKSKICFNLTHSKGLTGARRRKASDRIRLRKPFRQAAPRRTQQIHRAGEGRNFDRAGLLQALDGAGRATSNISANSLPRSGGKSNFTAAGSICAAKTRACTSCNLKRRTARSASAATIQNSASNAWTDADGLLCFRSDKQYTVKKVLRRSAGPFLGYYPLPKMVNRSVTTRRACNHSYNP